MLKVFLILNATTETSFLLAVDGISNKLVKHAIAKALRLFPLTTNSNGVRQFELLFPFFFGLETNRWMFNDKCWTLNSMRFGLTEKKKETFLTLCVAGLSVTLCAAFVQENCPRRTALRAFQRHINSFTEMSSAKPSWKLATNSRCNAFPCHHKFLLLLSCLA